jgi:hypothetical protein
MDWPNPTSLAKSDISWSGREVLRRMTEDFFELAAELPRTFVTKVVSDRFSRVAALNEFARQCHA